MFVDVFGYFDRFGRFYADWIKQGEVRAFSLTTYCNEIFIHSRA